MSNFFNQDNLFFRFMSILGDLIVLNLITLIFCLPVVTAGAAFTAMHSVLWHMVRGRETYVWRQFLDSFKRNWKQATPVWLVLLLVVLIVVFDIRYALGLSSSLRYAIETLVALVAVVAAAIGQYFFILLSRYDNPTKIQLANAARCAVAFFPRTIAMLVILIAFALVLLRYIVYAFPLFVLLGFSLPQYCCAWLYNPIFKKLDA